MRYVFLFSFSFFFKRQVVNKSTDGWKLWRWNVYDAGFGNSDPLIALSSLCLERHNGHPLKRLRNESWMSGKEWERTSETWTSSLALFPSASVHSYPGSKWCCPCTHEFLVVGFIAFLFVPPSPRLCGVSSKMGLFRGWVSAKQAGAKLFRWSCPWRPWKLGPWAHAARCEILTSLPAAPLFWLPSSWLAFQQRLLPPAPRRRGLSEVHLSVLRSTAWPVFEFQLTVKEQIHRRCFYDHSCLQPLSGSPQGLMHSRYTGKTG